ncbi:MAG TPA: flagellar basal body P-ring formation chaperone FlgA [Pseudolabrys sp.]|nr:flagellar basal body P-ring formation chaperone FlgA [Pseudolabrys sp.]
MISRLIRKILAACFATCLTLCALAAPAGAQTSTQSKSEHPTLKPEAIITGDIVRIGDLIDHAGIVASVPIFRAPDLGYSGTVSADAVLEAVRSHALIGVDTAGIHDIVVTRASRAIPAKEVQDLIAQTLSSRFDRGPSKDIVVTFGRDMHSIYVEPSARGEPRVTHMDFDTRSGRFDATLEVPMDVGKRNVLHVSGRATATVEVATVARAIDRGTILREADVQMEKRPRAEVGSDFITNHDDVVGQAARNSMQAGRLLRRVDLMKPDLVQRNEAVTLVYQVPGILLTIRGKANDAGAEGDSISVLNEQSKRVVQGVIIGPGRVAVSAVSQRMAANSARPPASADSR